MTLLVAPTLQKTIIIDGTLDPSKITQNPDGSQSYDAGDRCVHIPKGWRVISQDTAQKEIQESGRRVSDTVNSLGPQTLGMVTGPGKGLLQKLFSKLKMPERAQEFREFMAVLSGKMEPAGPGSFSQGTTAAFVAMVPAPLKNEARKAFQLVQSLYNTDSGMFRYLQFPDQQNAYRSMEFMVDILQDATPNTPGRISEAAGKLLHELREAVPTSHPHAQTVIEQLKKSLEIIQKATSQGH